MDRFSSFTISGTCNRSESGMLVMWKQELVYRATQGMTIVEISTGLLIMAMVKNKKKTLQMSEFPHFRMRKNIFSGGTLS